LLGFLCLSSGEKALSKCCKNHNIGEFHHNIESLHIVDSISRKGAGLNLTFQVRDGMISHDGEVHNTQLIPHKDKNEQDLKDYITTRKLGKAMSWMPATMEGCVVRISDTIAYIGQDIEDAIRFKILKRKDLPKECTDYLGNKNSKIIDTLVKSVIINSFEKDYISFDEETSYILKKLKAFNYKNIYTAESVKSFNHKIDICMEILFDKYLVDIKESKTNSMIFKHFINHKNDSYLSKFNSVEKVRDFIATMTDRYFNEEVKDYLLPGMLPKSR